MSSKTRSNTNFNSDKDSNMDTMTRNQYGRKFTVNVSNTSPTTKYENVIYSNWALNRHTIGKSVENGVKRKLYNDINRSRNEIVRSGGNISDFPCTYTDPDGNLVLTTYGQVNDSDWILNEIAKKEATSTTLTNQIEALYELLP